MKRITVINSGGGVAKTSTAVNLAASLAHKGHRVCAVDFDAQSTMSDWLGHDIADQQHLLLDILLGELEVKEALKQTYIPNLHLIPSSHHLYQAERHLADEVASDTLLDIALSQLDESYDFCVIDTPPQLGILSYNAMLAAPAGLIVPCEASYKSLKAMKALIRVVQLMKQRRCEEISILGILASRVDLRTSSSVQSVDILRENFGQLVFNTVITEAVAMKDAPAHHKAVMDYLPQSKTATQVEELTQEVLHRLNREGQSHAAA